MIAIPVRNESRNIERCLDALARAAGATIHPAETILLFNGCTDDTWDRVEHWARRSDMSLDLIDVQLASAINHAGGARAVALHLALRALADRDDGIVLTTDADSRVPPDWLERATRELAAGFDVLAGDFDVDVVSRALWSTQLRYRVEMEDAYGRLLDEVDSACDPVPHDPWPSHRRCSGANLVFRARALACLPSLPTPPFGEDRALIDACLAQGLRVRHDPHLRVETSGRLEGRATGGMAQALCSRTRQEQMPCDPMLESFLTHVHRATLRSRLRRSFQPGRTATELARDMSVSMPPDVAAAPPAPCHHFGDAWQQIERHAGELARVPLRPAELPDHIDAARRWLSLHATQRPMTEVAA